ncbi:hypothetical protein M404DRAFT_994426 [Pisolithus tinctorius Marx 270]|uniref:Uncharacterized protein n=1 Tax=Pisolithus tinctorius Marx 270 TaxID=870435 RepID=A0A0C3PSS0_PISTI|nr:hypothetical protein M404DRAFT_994426 [Pisolithus tinctorius Marx 270]
MGNIPFVQYSKVLPQSRCALRECYAPVTTTQLCICLNSTAHAPGPITPAFGQHSRVMWQEIYNQQARYVRL